MRGMTKMDLASLREKLNGLATATEKSIAIVDKDEKGEIVSAPCDRFKAIWNEKDNEVAAIASKHYTLIQHADAFNAVLDALSAVKDNATVKANVEEYKGKAWMTVVFDDVVANDGEKGIELGFKVLNSFDKTTSLRYGGTQTRHKEWFEFFGYRRVCANGMTVRVPNINLNSISVKGSSAKVGEFTKVQLEKVEARVQEAAVTGTVRHYGKIAEAQMMAIREALMKLPLVVSSLEEQIKAAQSIGMTQADARKRLTELKFAPRTIAKLIEIYKTQEQNQWGLYNSATYFASHTDGMSPQAVEYTLKTAAPLMQAKVTAKVDKR